MVKIGYKVIPQAQSAIINTYTYFYPCDSWLNKTNIKKSTVHEQLHFDIAEYHRRLFLEALFNNKSSENMFGLTTRAIFKDIVDQRRKMNTEYDIKTKSGQDEEGQIIWNKKISGLVSSLEKYKENMAEIIFR